MLPKLTNAEIRGGIVPVSDFAAKFSWHGSRVPSPTEQTVASQDCSPSSADVNDPPDPVQDASVLLKHVQVTPLRRSSLRDVCFVIASPRLPIWTLFGFHNLLR